MRKTLPLSDIRSEAESVLTLGCPGSFQESISQSSVGSSKHPVSEVGVGQLPITAQMMRVLCELPDPQIPTRPKQLAVRNVLMTTNTNT